MIKPIIITLHLTDYLDKAFKTIPANANIHKGRCGIGGTTLEIKASRNSIIVVPTKGTITDKHSSYPKLFAVKGKVSVEEIADYLASSVRHKKIMTTPDSFENIIKAAISIGKLDELYRDYFLLMDESHAVITEGFRKKMIVPFQYFWDFKSHTLISATPFEFSDPKFAKLTPYYIKFHESRIGKVTVIHTDNIEDCVDDIIRHRNRYPGILCFYYNSVKEGAEAIRRNNLTSKEVHMYCADKEENFEKLPEHLLVFQQQPETGKYAAINFFTTKYFEGVDLIEKDATIFLITDIHKPHTKVGITNKGVQALGRARALPGYNYNFYHITNNRNKRGMKTLNQFRTEYKLHTTKLINDYNSYINDCKAANIDPVDNADSLIAKFTVIDEHTLIATLHPTKLDIVVNELACNEEFNNKEGIVQAWEKSLYQVEQQPYLKIGTVKKRKSKADRLRELIEHIEDLELNKGKYVMGAVAKELAAIQAENPLVMEAYCLLGKAKLIELKYNEKAIERILIEHHNMEAEPRLLAYLDTKLHIGDKKTITELSSLLQYGYNLFQIRHPATGKIKVAYASQLGEAGRYKIDEGKVTINEKQINSFTISKKYFTVSKAA